MSVHVISVHVIILHACSMCVHVCVWYKRYTYMYMVHVQKLDMYAFSVCVLYMRLLYSLTRA